MITTPPPQTPQNCSVRPMIMSYWRRLAAVDRVLCIVPDRRARQKSLNRTVAIKIIGINHGRTKAHLKRFRLEAEAAAKLNHPFVVPIHEIGQRKGRCYFSMGLVEGGRLDQIAKREPMSPRQATEVIAKLARTVHYRSEEHTS